MQCAYQAFLTQAKAFPSHPMLKPEEYNSVFGN
jgi:hypothetical protein